MAVESIIGAVASIAVIIFVHELGHFLVAKRCGVDVLVFSLGFGPKLLSYRSGETEYRLSLIPLGGYVRMAGQDDLRDPAGGQADDAPVAEGDIEGSGDPARRFSAKSLGQRTAIVAAGPTVNLLFAFLLFAVAAAIYGSPVAVEEARIAGVREGGPAASAGLRTGDTVVAIDDASVAGWEDLAGRVRESGGTQLAFTVIDAEGRSRSVTVVPERHDQRDMFGEVTGETFMVGIERAFENQAVGIIEAAGIGARQTWFWTRVIFETLVRLFQGRVSASDLGGPIMIAQEAGRRAAHGLEPLLRFMALISVNLGVINVLPIPVLDGGHLLFFGIEGLRGRPLSVRYRELAQQVGVFLLLALMVFVVFNDISRIVGN